MTDLTKYQKLSEIQHILARPGMYVGSITNTEMDFFVHDLDESIKLKTITSNPGLVKLFDEVVSNSVDEHLRSGLVTIIEVTISQMTGEITIKDNGGIPVKKHPEFGLWIPSMIFGELRTGSNFGDEDRTTAGLNGLGAKLTSVMSKTFTVTTCDGKNKFVQIFRDNLSVKENPSITKSNIAGTTISFVPDYERLGCSLDEGNLARIKRRVYDIAGCNPKIKVFYNGEIVKTNKFPDYVDLYVGEHVYESNGDWEVAVGPNDDDTFRQISFVNGVDTFNGGSHIDYVANQITNKLREYVKRKHKIDVKPNNIRQQMMLFINCKINAPMFTSQTKEYMSTDVKDFGTSYEVSDKFINKLIKSEIVQRILDWASSQQRQKELAELRKLEKRKKVHKSDKYFPATKQKKILIAGEGQSALGGLIPSLGRDVIGYYEMRGKPLNCFNASVTKFKDNKELSEIYSILCNEDYEYFICGTDADLDGSHIRMLLVSFVLKYVPEYKGKFGFLNTPVMAVKKNGKLVRWYYSLRDHVETKSGETIQYYKGLGTWDYKDLKQVVLKDGLETMIRLFDFSDEELYTNWLQDDRVETRKDLLGDHSFSIANL